MSNHNNYYYYQQYVPTQQIGQQVPVTNNNGLEQIHSGLCQMLTNSKILSTMQKKRGRQQKVDFPNVSFSQSGLIEPLGSNATQNGYYQQYYDTEILIAEYKQALKDVYGKYISKNSNNRALNNEFISFSKTLTDNLFDVIKKYQKCFLFNNLLLRKRSPNQQLSIQENEEYERLLDENDEKQFLLGGPLDMDCKSAIKKATKSLKEALSYFNNRAQDLIRESADNLFIPNHKGDSVDDMAADDCVFNNINIKNLFKRSDFDSLDRDAKATFLEKLLVDEGELNSGVHFICDISTFTDALLAAAESTFDEYSVPDGNQQRCVANCIKNAMDVATAGWEKYHKYLFKQMDGEQKRIVHDKYKKIFTKIQQCKVKYNLYLQDKSREEDGKSEKRKIQALINKNNNVKIKLPREIGMINNNVSMVGLNLGNNFVVDEKLF